MRVFPAALLAPDENAMDSVHRKAADGIGPRATDPEISVARESKVGATTVRRALPQRHRRTVGPWCFEDHMGPTHVTPAAGIDVGPHPHIGLQTVTWLIEGEILHKDSLGTEQLIKPGQVNLMTAGHGVVHAEESTGSYRGRLQGVQLWVAQPEQTRHSEPAFEHHSELPRLDIGPSTATVITGTFNSNTSPSRQDWDSVGVEGQLRKGRTVWPLTEVFEHGLIVIDGSIHIGAQVLRPGQFAYFRPGSTELAMDALADATVILIGGKPFEEPVLIWWNLVARTTDEIDDAYLGWLDGRIGDVDTRLAAMPTPAPPWFRR